MDRTGSGTANPLTFMIIRLSNYNSEFEFIERLFDNDGVTDLMIAIDLCTI